jgi:hypothetical protein
MEQYLRKLRADEIYFHNSLSIGTSCILYHGSYIPGGEPLSISYHLTTLEASAYSILFISTTCSRLSEENNSPISRAQPSTNIPSILTIRRTSLIALDLRTLPLILLTSQASTYPIGRAETPADVTCVFAVCGTGFEA